VEWHAGETDTGMASFVWNAAALACLSILSASCLQHARAADDDKNGFHVGRWRVVEAEEKLGGEERATTLGGGSVTVVEHTRSTPALWPPTTGALGLLDHRFLFMGMSIFRWRFAPSVTLHAIGVLQLPEIAHGTD